MNGKYETFELRCNVCNRKLGFLRCDIYIPANNPNEHGKEFPAISRIISRIGSGLDGKILCSHCYKTRKEIEE